MLKKRVLLVESGHFLGGVISSLFSGHENIFLIEASPTSGAELLRVVREHEPHIVVLDDTLNKKYLNQLLRFMQTAEDLRVVIVGADSNQVEVYQKQEVPVRRTADFFALL